MRDACIVNIEGVASINACASFVMIDTNSKPRCDQPHGYSKSE